MTPGRRRRLGPESLVLVAFFLSTCGQAIIRPASTYRALELGAGVREVGLIVAAYSAVAVVFAIPVGRRVDRTGTRQGIVLGSLLLAVSAAGSAYGTNLAMLAATMAVGGVAHVYVMLSAQAFAASAGSTTDRRRQFARNSVANSLGQIVGPLLLGWSVSVSHGMSVRSTVELAFLLTAGIGVLAAVLGGVLGRVGAAPVDKQDDLSFGLIAQLVGRRGMSPALAAGITIVVAQDILVAYLPLIGTAANLSPATVGVLLSLRGIASLLSRLWMMSILRRLGLRVVLVLTMVAPAAAMAALVWSHALWQFVVPIAVFGFFVGIGTPLTASWVAQLSPEHLRATTLGLRISGNRLGQTFIPIGLGAVGAATGVGAVFLAPALALFVCGCWIVSGDLGAES
ncbi:MFS transporter [Actinophytocola sp.]|uniref:MFS transporter n=1 Tax=Actinophytocola sp. TaxID=1872138 RepID=UPI003D6BC016